MAMESYIVIVYPAPPMTRPDLQSSGQSWSGKTQPTVKRHTARSPAQAAEDASVPAGGYALVIQEKDAKRFDRAAVAPLEQKRPDGNSLPRAVNA